VSVEVPGRGGKSRTKPAHGGGLRPRDRRRRAGGARAGRDAAAVRAEGRDGGRRRDRARLPAGRPFKATAARIRDQIDLRGLDIYNSQTVVRDVYTIRAVVRSGNSGGPLLAPNGTVYGIVFGAAQDDPETGFVLTAQQVEPLVSSAPRLSNEVSTGSCAA